MINKWFRRNILSPNAQLHYYVTAKGYWTLSFGRDPSANWHVQIGRIVFTTTPEG